MSNQRHRGAKATVNLRLWTYAHAVKARPYLRAIVRSLREHWLSLQFARMQVQRLDARPERPDWEALILRAEAAREVELAEEQFHDVLGELNALHVNCLDPAKGLALIPFRKGDDLAWFVFDLFAPQGLEGWRFQTDSVETRRQLVEILDPRLVDQVLSSRSADDSIFPAGRP